MRIFPFLALLLPLPLAALAPFAAADATPCTDASPSAHPAPAVGVVERGESAAFRVDDVGGSFVRVVYHAAPPSHGSLRWRLLDRDSGAEFANSTAIELNLALLGVSPYEDLCLVVTNEWASTKEFAFQFLVTPV